MNYCCAVSLGFELLRAGKESAQSSLADPAVPHLIAATEGDVQGDSPACSRWWQKGTVPWAFLSCPHSWAKCSVTWVRRGTFSPHAVPMEAINGNRNECASNRPTCCHSTGSQAPRAEAQGLPTTSPCPPSPHPTQPKHSAEGSTLQPPRWFSI